MGEPWSAGDLVDAGDYFEIPLVEEVLMKVPVVREVVRVRKTSRLGRAIVSGEVRKEDVVVERRRARPPGDEAPAGDERIADERSRGEPRRPDDRRDAGPGGPPPAP